MRFKNPIVDRIWLGMIGVSFLLWNVIMYDRLGPHGLGALYLIGFLIARLRS